MQIATASTAPYPLPLPTTLTQTTTPEDLFYWVTHYILVAPKLKAFVQPADEVVESLRANNWEIANLVYADLTAMGYECKLLYLETNKQSIAYTTVVYHRPGGAWRWFHWSTPTEACLGGPWNTLAEVVNQVKTYFKARHKAIAFSSLGEEVIQTPCVVDDYLEMVHRWKRPPRYSK